MNGQPMATPSGKDPGGDLIRRIFREEFAKYAKRAQGVGWVTGLDPLTVKLRSGGTVDVSARDATLALAEGDYVALLWTGDGYIVTGLAGAPDGPQIVHHSHNQNDITDPVMEVIGTAVGDGSSGTLAVPDIPATFRHLRVVGRLAHDGGGNFVDARLRWNNLSSANYYGVRSRWSADGTSNVGQFIDADSGWGFSCGNIAGTFEAFIPDYTALTSRGVKIQVFARIGTGNTQQRTIEVGGWLNNFTVPIDDVRVVLSSGNWTTAADITVYGLRG